MAHVVALEDRHTRGFAKACRKIFEVRPRQVGVVDHRRGDILELEHLPRQPVAPGIGILAHVAGLLQRTDQA